MLSPRTRRVLDTLAGTIQCYLWVKATRASDTLDTLVVCAKDLLEYSDMVSRVRRVENSRGDFSLSFTESVEIIES